MAFADRIWRVRLCFGSRAVRQELAGVENAQGSEDDASGRKPEGKEEVRCLVAAAEFRARCGLRDFPALRLAYHAGKRREEIARKKVVSPKAPQALTRGLMDLSVLDGLLGCQREARLGFAFPIHLRRDVLAHGRSVLESVP